MKISLNWVKRFTNVDISNEELIDTIGAQLGGVEEIINLGELYRDIVVVKVVDCQPHPNADRLHVCKIDDNQITHGVDRDGNGYIQVVCGAPNVEKDLMVSWIPPGAVVPSTHKKEPLTLDVRELRGVKSSGMLASGKELAINDDDHGLLIIDIETKPGRLLSEIYELDDVIIDIENKMLTHRPDCFGQLGIAREIAGITNKQFHSPSWYLNKPELSNATDTLELKIKNEIPKLVPRFMTQVISNVSVKPSPIIMQSYLSRVGIRPINNIVDGTNLIMMVSGQPMHAYDYDKLKSLDPGASNPTIIIRHPNNNESITLLNGKTVKPSKDAILIASATKAIGLGGVMGGAETEVDSSTKNIILECASFDMYSIRKMSMSLGLFTDAVTRFSKGQSLLQNDRVLAQATAEICKYTGGQIAGPADDNKEILPKYVELSISADFINNKLGLDLSANEIAKLLKNVEFQSEVKYETINIVTPFWRSDIAIAEDIVEEIGRLNGYSNIPMKLPSRDLMPASTNKMLDLKSKISYLFARAGSNEALTYSFVHGQLIDKVGQDSEKAFQLSNAISPDLQYYRLSLLPSLLDKVHANIKAGFDEFSIFEINKVHIKGAQDSEDPNLPLEDYRLAIVCAYDDKFAQKQHLGAPYYQAKFYLDYLLSSLGIDYSIEQCPKDPSSESGQQLIRPFELIRTGSIKVNNESIGAVGEPVASIRRSLKLPRFTAMFEINLITLLGAISENHYKKLSHFPKVEQDICFKVPINTTYQDLLDLFAKELESEPGKLQFSLTPLDIYQRDDDKEHKQITFRLNIASHSKTLTSKEVNTMLSSAAQTIKKELNAEVI